MNPGSRNLLRPERRVRDLPRLLEHQVAVPEPVVVAGGEKHSQRRDLLKHRPQESGGVRREPLLLVEVTTAAQRLYLQFGSALADASQGVTQRPTPGTRQLHRRPAKRHIQVQVSEMQQPHVSAPQLAP